MTSSFVKDARLLMLKATQSYKTPPQQLVNFIDQKGQQLAKRHGANELIVAAGTSLMDCCLGRAIAEGKQAEHVQMAVQATKDLLAKYPSIRKEDAQNIIACVAEHHGGVKFSSLDSEICCNADCYKFASVEGFLLSLRYMRDMPLNALIALLQDKLEEKWNALTLEDCKRELEPQYRQIKSLLASYSRPHKNS